MSAHVGGGRVRLDSEGALVRPPPKTAFRSIRSWWLVVAFLSGFALAMAAEELILSTHDNQLEFSAPRVHFLGGGRPLELLHNAAPVDFDFQVTVWSGSRDHVFRRIAERFVVSYDLWEEKFSVAELQGARKTASHLAASAAEAWCVGQMAIDVTGLDAGQPFWARLEIRAQDRKENGPLFGHGRISDSGISLTSLIEIFSRPPQAAQSHWTLDAGPLTLNELRRSHGRGS
jgi:hypothetical protein